MSDTPTPKLTKVIEINALEMDFHILESIDKCTIRNSYDPFPDSEIPTKPAQSIASWGKAINQVVRSIAPCFVEKIYLRGIVNSAIKNLIDKASAELAFLDMDVVSIITREYSIFVVGEECDFAYRRRLDAEREERVKIETAAQAEREEKINKLRKEAAELGVSVDIFFTGEKEEVDKHRKLNT